MYLFIESPSTSRGLQSRARDDKKISNHSDSVGNKVHKDDPMDSKSSSTALGSDDVYEFKSLKDTTGESPDRKTATDSDADADKKKLVPKILLYIIMMYFYHTPIVYLKKIINYLRTRP